ncbi:hypothetical protein UlMin_038343 [Ulmus minor]
MEHLLLLSLLLLLLLLPKHTLPQSATSSCRSTCGSLEIKYPFGTGSGCGSPRFQPYVTCKPTGAANASSSSDVLLLTTHTGSYPITSISYATSTLTVTPTYMSTCTSMQTSHENFGIDWSGPFQLGSSSFVLLSCQRLSSSLCDISSHLCASLYTCPSVVALGLPLFPPTNTCCVYSPANLNNKDELDLGKLNCAGFASIVSVGDFETDPAQWEYGVGLKYNSGVLVSDVVESKCKSCEMSGGICGYSVSDRGFLCVCKTGFNTTTDCYGRGAEPEVFWDDDYGSASSPTWKVWYGFFASLIIWIIAT